MCELENELSSVKSNLSKSNKSLQECHQLIRDQKSISDWKLEAEQKRHDDEMFEREKELDEIAIELLTLEKEKTQSSNQESCISTVCIKSNMNEDILRQDTEAGIDVVSEEVSVSPTILCRDSQEENVDDEMKVG